MPVCCSSCSFFEWDRKGKTKRPYFIHFQDNKPTADMLEVAVEEVEGGDGNLQGSSKIDPDVVNGRLLTMAGLFDISTTEVSPVAQSASV